MAWVNKTMNIYGRNVAIKLNTANSRTFGTGRWYTDFANENLGGGGVALEDSAV